LQCPVSAIVDDVHTSGCVAVHLAREDMPVASGRRHAAHLPKVALHLRLGRDDTQQARDEPRQCPIVPRVRARPRCPGPLQRLR